MHRAVAAQKHTVKNSQQEQFFLVELQTERKANTDMVYTVTLGRPGFILGLWMSSKYVAAVA